MQRASRQQILDLCRGRAWHTSARAGGSPSPVRSLERCLREGTLETKRPGAASTRGKDARNGTSAFGKPQEQWRSYRRKTCSKPLDKAKTTVARIVMPHKLDAQKEENPHARKPARLEIPFALPSHTIRARVRSEPCMPSCTGA